MSGKHVTFDGDTIRNNRLWGYALANFYLLDGDEKGYKLHEPNYEHQIGTGDAHAPPVLTEY